MDPGGPIDSVIHHRQFSNLYLEIDSSWRCNKKKLKRGETSREKLMGKIFRTC